MEDSSAWVYDCRNEGKREKRKTKRKRKITESDMRERQTKKQDDGTGVMRYAGIDVVARSEAAMLDWLGGLTGSGVEIKRGCSWARMDLNLDVASLMDSPPRRSSTRMWWWE